MKALKIIILTIFIIIVFIVAGLFIAIRNFDVNKLRPRIVQEISQALGRDVDIGNLKIDISLDKGAVLNIGNLSIENDPAFSKEDFLNVKRVHLGLDIESLIKSRQLRILSIELVSPKILLVRNSDSKLSTQNLFTPKRKRAPDSEEHKFESKVNTNIVTNKKEGITSRLLSTLHIKSFRLNGGTVVYVDRTFDAAVSVELSNIDLAINDFSLNRPTNFNLEASLFSSSKNIRAKGEVELDLDNFTIHFRNIKANSNLSDISVIQLKQSLSILQDLEFKEGIGGSLTVDISNLIIDRQGLSKMLMDGTLNDGKVSLRQMFFPLSNIDIDFVLNERDVEIKECLIPFASGKVYANGSIQDYTGSKAFNFEMTLEDLNLTQMIPQEDQSVKLHGKLFGNLTLGGLKTVSFLTGDGKLEIKDGKLVNVNVLKLVLSKISMLPKLVKKLEENLPEKYKDKLKEKDTELQKVKLDIMVVDKYFIVKNAEIKSDVFLIKGEGKLNFDQTLSLDADIYLPEDLSNSMATTTNELQYLVNDSGNIYIPIKIKGQIPKLSYLPDLKYLGKKIIVQRGKEELQKVLKKVLRGDEDDQAEGQGAEQKEASPDGVSQEESPKQEEEQSPEEKLIDSVLDAIFN